MLGDNIITDSSIHSWAQPWLLRTFHMCLITLVRFCSLSPHNPWPHSRRKVCKRDYSCLRQVSSPNPDIFGEAMDVIHLDADDTNNPNSVRVFVSLTLPQAWELGPEPWRIPKANSEKGVERITTYTQARFLPTSLLLNQQSNETKSNNEIRTIRKLEPGSVFHSSDLQGVVPNWVVYSSLLRVRLEDPRYMTLDGEGAPCQSSRVHSSNKLTKTNKQKQQIKQPWSFHTLNGYLLLHHRVYLNFPSSRWT